MKSLEISQFGLSDETANRIASVALDAIDKLVGDIIVICREDEASEKVWDQQMGISILKVIGEAIAGI